LIAGGRLGRLSYHEGVTEEPIRYQARLLELQSGLARLRRQHLANTAAFTISSLLFLLLGFQVLRHNVPGWWCLLPIPIAAFSLRGVRQLAIEQVKMRRLRSFYAHTDGRVRGEWQRQGLTGDEFLRDGHLYAADLSVFGEGSLFELLCTARTAIGRRGLANYLLEAPSLEETRARQDAVRELRPCAVLREKIALLGEFEFSDSKWESFTDWLDSPAMPFSPALRAAAAASSTLLLGIVLARVGGPLSWTMTATLAAPLVLFHAIVGQVFRERVKRMAGLLRAASGEVGTLREGLQLLEEQSFRSAKLVCIGDRIRNAAGTVHKLERLLYLFNERNKEWFYHGSLVLLAGTQLCMAIERWRAEHGSALRDWMEAWAEFEAVSALAGYAYENPDGVFPDFSEGGARFEARALGHPLMRNESCVRNDVRLNGETRFYVISGSNMSGKSSLLRAIGLNAVLAFAGAPVRAETMCISPQSVCASISIVDSLLNGKSKFLAEVERLGEAIRLAGDRSTLFLVDEIFSGTNSRDRRAAAEAVVRTLVERGAIGALSTHDMSLTEIADAQGLQGVNVHMGSRGGDDPMDFDYLLKPGITQERNAAAIARMAGVPV